VIKSFVDKRTAAIFAGYMVRDLPLQIQKRARAKLIAIDAAKRLDDLRIPPGNRPQKLHSRREGQHQRSMMRPISRFSFQRGNSAPDWNTLQ